jgi:hypothetical protein
MARSTSSHSASQTWSILDAIKVSGNDEYDRSALFAEYGNHSHLQHRNHSFKFTMVGRNASGSGYTEAFDYTKLTPQ